LIFIKSTRGPVKVIYDEDFVGDESVAVGEISSCVFNSGGKIIMRFYYEKDKGQGGDYYDENGNRHEKQCFKITGKVFENFIAIYYEPVSSGH